MQVVPAFPSDLVGRNLKSREMLADRHGQRAPGNAATSADPHENEKFKLAHELAQILDQAFEQHRFQHLVVVAPPDMLGKIRHNLPETVSRHIIMERPKELTQLPDDELAERLQALAQAAE
jgi:protein required for attachment to host cells